MNVLASNGSFFSERRRRVTYLFTGLYIVDFKETKTSGNGRQNLLRFDIKHPSLYTAIYSRTIVQ
jgi:hypothetical protein